MKRKRRTARKKRPTVSSRKKFTRNKGRYNKLPKRSYRKKITRKKTRHKKKRKRTIRKKKIYYGGAAGEGEVVIEQDMKELKRDPILKKSRGSDKFWLRSVVLYSDGRLEIHKKRRGTNTLVDKGVFKYKRLVQHEGYMAIDINYDSETAADDLHNDRLKTFRTTGHTEDKDLNEWRRLAKINGKLTILTEEQAEARVAELKALIVAGRATEMDNIEMEQLTAALEKGGAPREGYTALEIAKKKNKPRMAALLEAAEADPENTLAPFLAEVAELRKLGATEGGLDLILKNEKRRQRLAQERRAQHQSELEDLRQDNLSHEMSPES